MESKKQCSIIVPTYKEATNIPQLIESIAKTHFDGRLFEVILMDDNSQDGTSEVVDQLKVNYPWLRLVVRQGTRGLSRSVIDGLSEARYPYLVIMDADLSHPADKIPEMLLRLDDPDVDMVIGSRYVKGGSVDEVWPLLRIILSRLSGALARIIIGKNVKDPLSGFIAIKKSSCQSVELDPIGWKISIELIVKCRCKQIVEVPIHFAQRYLGASKLNARVGLSYIGHLFKLLYYRIFMSHAVVK